EEDADDDTLTTETLSPEVAETSHSSDTQVQDLLQEVQQLREELRSRDRTIAQLTHQLTVPAATSRCRCQETTGRVDRHTQTSVTERESVASQTPWREHTSQIFRPSRQEEPSPLTPNRAPPPAADACSPRPPADPPADPPAPTGGGEEDDGKTVKKKERRGTSVRSLVLPQPSKLRLFLSQTPSLAFAPPSLTLPPSLAFAPSPPAPKRTPPLGSGSSRLPKPKSH
ncbi:serine-rich coiled-coil domain-containing protein 2-like isoform X2, partial [Scomber scombrus]